MRNRSAFNLAQNKKTATTQILGIVTAVIPVIPTSTRCARENTCHKAFLQVSRLAHLKLVQ
jgi:hypothetical protein